MFKVILCSLSLCSEFHPEIADLGFTIPSNCLELLFDCLMGLLDLCLVFRVDRLQVPFTCGLGFFCKLLEPCCGVFLGFLLGLPLSGGFQL